MLTPRVPWEELCEFTSRLDVHVDLTSETVVVPSLAQDSENNMTVAIMGTSGPVKFQEKKSF